MNTVDLEREFRRKVSEQVRIEAQGLERYVVFQPFMFDDGDHFVVVLKKDRQQWIFTDEGHTLMHVQYEDIDLRRGPRASILDSTLNALSLENREGELRLVVPEEQFGDALYSFLQALNKVTDLDFLTKERVRSTFLDDARSLIEELVPSHRCSFEYHDPDRDPDMNYVVDCRINARPRQDFVFFIQSDYRCLTATIVCHQFERWGVRFRATGIFEDQAEIHRRALAQFSDVAYKHIPNLGSRDRIQAYFREVLEGQA